MKTQNVDREIEPLYSTQTLCQVCELSQRNIRRLVACGRFPRPDLKIGRRLRWRKSTIESYLSGGEATKGVAS